MVITRALDLGSGYGYTIATLAHLGIPEVFGIEANVPLVGITNSVIAYLRQSQWIDASIFCRAYLGNFFPQDFDVSNDVRWDKLAKISADVKKCQPLSRNRA